MVTTLSKIVEMIERGAIPAWVREQVFSNKEEIAQALRENGSYTLTGPNGEEIEIRVEKAVAA